MHARWVGCLEGCLGGARACELLLRGFGGGGGVWWNKVLFGDCRDCALFFFLFLWFVLVSEVSEKLFLAKESCSLGESREWGIL